MRSMAKGAKVLVDTGNPTLNNVVDGFLKVGGVGALQAAGKESYRLVMNDEMNRRGVERVVYRMGQESLSWGVAAGVYAGVASKIQRNRGTTNSWKDAMVAGAVTGAAMTLIGPRPRQDTFVHNMITGGAVATAAEFLRRIC